ncbi:delta(3,5)-Delta(2,4)-dienoyl-CoA isomerase, peroxisomal-like [Magnolia sinica]|uniref:delta(3,5)-Delta(2,4)-dienoyl-CoA isomerase, peroxisomal-like n=1 Tax=Magnolia sinica TaxID=86752 RepID=UPI00265AC953|nr:delta(3,5)-Delta(2,4)-dienoyl-CoA isomerase, peroxisomal-like [Magnolia sinica]
MEKAMDFTTLEIVQKFPNSPVFHLFLNNPSRHNALTLPFFSEFPKAISLLDESPSVRLIVLSARGNNFCSGIDVSVLDVISKPQQSNDAGRIREQLYRQIKGLQESTKALEQCRKPIIAEINGACIGGAIDIVAACDIRYCTEKAFFVVKEVDMAITADIGALQRLPRIVGFGNAMEMILTCRKINGREAKELGLISKVFASKEEMEEGVRVIAEAIAAKSPLTVAGTKQVMLKSRDLTINQGLDYVAVWNAAMLLSDDLDESIAAHIQKRKPIYAKL